VKGTIRERKNKDGSRVYECQVRLGKDPARGLSMADAADEWLRILAFGVINQIDCTDK
jgi:hypothetical protein